MRLSPLPLNDSTFYTCSPLWLNNAGIRNSLSCASQITIKLTRVNGDVDIDTTCCRILWKVWQGSPLTRVMHFHKMVVFHQICWFDISILRYYAMVNHCDFIFSVFIVLQTKQIVLFHVIIHIYIKLLLYIKYEK